MLIKDARIYTDSFMLEDPDAGKSFPSMIKACQFIYKHKDNTDLFLCAGHYNLAGLEKGENLSHYYKRMTSLFHTIMG